MNIAKAYWRRIFASPLHILFLLVVPIGLTVVTLVGLSGQSQIAVAWVDQDTTALSQSLHDHLNPRARLIAMEEGDVWAQLAQQKVQYAVVIPEGFAQALLNDGEVPKVQTSSLGSTNIEMPLALALDNAINAAVLLSRRAQGEEDLFWQGWNQYLSGRFSVEKQAAAEVTTDSSLQAVGFLVMSMLFLASFSTMYIVRDRQTRVVMRILLSPTSLRRYMIESMASFVAISWLQVLAVTTVLHWGFGFDFGPNPQNVIMILALFSLVGVAFGVSISNFVGSVRSAGTISSLFITPMCMLGGCFWPRAGMPQLLQDIAQFVPTTWAVEGSMKAIMGYSLMEMRWEFLILSLFAVVFLTLGSWKKPDIVR